MPARSTTASWRRTPKTNWAAIEAFRHISVHDDEKVRREIVEGIVAHHLDDTIRQLEAYLRELG